MAHEVGSIELQIKVTFSSGSPIISSQGHYETRVVDSPTHIRKGVLDTLPLVQSNISNLRPLYQAILKAIELEESVAEVNAQTL